MEIKYKMEIQQEWLIVPFPSSNVFPISVEKERMEVDERLSHVATSQLSRNKKLQQVIPAGLCQI